MMVPTRAVMISRQGRRRATEKIRDIADEIKRGDAGIAGIDPHLLEAEGEEEWPQDVGEGSGREQRGEAGSRRRGPGREAQTEVADEHPESLHAVAVPRFFDRRLVMSERRTFLPLDRGLGVLADPPGRRIGFLGWRRLFGLLGFHHCS
jgi:hypothetical protein